MIGRWFYKTVKDPATLSRIEKQKEFENVLILIEKLRDKNKELQGAADQNGYDSLDRSKAIIISDLVKKLDEKLKKYNQKNSANVEMKIEAPVEFKQEFKEIEMKAVPLVEHKEESQQEGDKKEIIQFAQELTALFKTTWDTHQAIINEPRGYTNKTETAKHLVELGSVAAGFGVAGLCTSTAGAVATFCYGSYLLNTKSKKILGLDKPPQTASAILISSLIEATEHVAQNVALSLDLKLAELRMEAQNSFDEFMCPINLTIMKDPYFCTLDGMNYEKEAIEEWLTAHKTSPTTRKEMRRGQKLEDVLIKNRPLKALIEKFGPKNQEEAKAEPNLRLN